MANLEWSTHAEQNRHAFANNKDRKCAGQVQKKAVQGRLFGSENWSLEFDSITTTNKTLGVICGPCCHGRHKSATSKKDGQRYEFRFKPQPDLPGEIWKDVEV